jgi:lysine-N-methylase
VLLNPQLMQAGPRLLADGNSWRQKSMVGRNDPDKRDQQQYLWELRSLILLLLQDRTYPLWQRLFILGMLCKRLREIFAGRQTELTAKLLRDYAEIIEQGKLRSVMDRITPQTAMQLAAVLEVIRRYNEPKIGDPSQVRFRECLQDFLHGIRFDQSVPVDLQFESCAQCYKAAHNSYYEPFMREHPYMLENYLINYSFRTNFPFGADIRKPVVDPQNEFLKLSIQYAAIKGFLIGIAGHYKGDFSPGHVVKLVQSFSRAVEHCPAFLETSNPRMADTDGMAVLLKT